MCENCQGQICKAFIGLTIGAKIIGGDDPFYLKFWVKVTTLWRNRTSLHSHSLGGVTIDCLCCRLCHSGWRQTYNVSKILSPVPVFHFRSKVMYPAARSLCDSWASCSAGMETS